MKRISYLGVKYRFNSLQVSNNIALFTKVIDTDLHLKAICCFPVWTNHHTSVVDEDVEFGLWKQWKQHREVKRCSFKIPFMCSVLWGTTVNLCWWLQRILWSTCCPTSRVSGRKHSGWLSLRWFLSQRPLLSPCRDTPWWSLPLRWKNEQHLKDISINNVCTHMLVLCLQSDVRVIWVKSAPLWHNVCMLCSGSSKDSNSDTD